MTEHPHPYDQIRKWHNDRLRPGTVDISASALNIALDHIRLQKELAVESHDDEEAARWRDEEKSILVALGGYGLRFITE